MPHGVFGRLNLGNMCVNFTDWPLDGLHMLGRAVFLHMLVLVACVL